MAHGVNRPAERSRWVARIVPAAGLGACPTHPDAPAVPRPAGETSDRARRCQRWTLAVVCLASALLLFNVTAPNVALPAIAADLGAGFTAQQWVLSVYALVLASLLLAGGVIGDLAGRRRVFLLGLLVFGLGSTVAALAGDTRLLIAGRVLQGLGAAALFPSGLALIAAEFAGPARARAIGVWGASVSGAIALGPLLGGVLVETLGWRAQFGFAVLLVLPAVAVGWRHLRESRDPSGARLDWVGAGLLTIALLLLVVLLQQANRIGWTSPVTLSMGLASALAFVAFLAVEFRSAAPLIAPALLRDTTFLGATFVALVFAVAGFAPLVYLTLFLLQVADSSPTLAGLQVAPFALVSLVVSLLAARVATRFGARACLAGGLVLCGAGLVLLLGLTPDSDGLRLLPGLVVFGVGAGIVNPTMTVAALSTVDVGHSGMASGVNNTARQVGIAAGIAGLGAVLQARLSDQLGVGLVERGVPAAAAQRAAEAAAGGDVVAATRMLGAAGPELSAVYDVAFSGALTTVVLVAIGITAVGAVVTLALVRSTGPAAEKEPPMSSPEAGAQVRSWVVADASGPSAKATCDHLGQALQAWSSGRDGCEDCLREGSQWVHLRKCLACGHIGCCDDSPRKHATGHWNSSGHPVVATWEPGERWAWCYSDQVILAPAND